MKTFIHWPSFLIALAIIASVSVLVNRLTNLGFWPVFSITVFAFLLNGFVATLEDDLPGGFNNQDGTSTPRYAVVASGVGRFTFLLSCALATSLFVLFAHEAGFLSRQGLMFGGLAGATVLAYLAATRNYRWALWAAGSLVVCPIVLGWLQNGG